jgi:hypothetical protein
MSHLYDKNALYENAVKYCISSNTVITTELGHGTQGIVYQTQRNTAIKVYSLKQGYERERNVYIRLKERGIDFIQRLALPRIRTWDDNLLILEMSIVHVPCMLDFGGAYLDYLPEHLNRDDVWFKDKQIEFGDNWEEAMSVIREIEHRADLWLADINTGNIKFGD